MKKGIIIALSTVLTIFLQSCDPSTAVRVLSLSYEGQPMTQTLNNPVNITNRFDAPKRASVEDSYIYPGDILTFTVELEDPNYEFISLLSIKFNGETIRANSDDSIVSTRDCGTNICVDFPFEVKSQVTEYAVEEVRFAKLGSSGVSAIIDSGSSNRLILNVWESAVFPNVLSSVETINELLSSINYQSIDELLEHFGEAENLTNKIKELFQTRTLKLLNADRHYLGDSGIQSIKFESNLDSLELVTNDSYGPIDRPTVQMIEMFSGTDSFFLHWYFQSNFSILDTLLGEYLGNYSTTQYHNLYFGLLDNSFEDTFAYNQGNDIYLSIKGENVFFYRMARDTKIVSY